MAMNRQRRTSNISNIFSYDDAGNIVIKDYSQVIRYSWNGTIHGFIGPVSVSSVAAATTDTDKFLVSDGGVLKFRTGAEILSDIGGQPVLTNPVTGTGVVGQVAYWNGTNSQTGSATLTYTPTTSLLVNNSVTAASSIARGTNLTPTLVAAANNDVLVGLDINPTFTNGAFTGVSNHAIRVPSFNTTSSQIRVGSLELQSYSLNNSWLSDNMFFNGTGFQYRNTGKATLFYFFGGEGQFRSYASASAGTVVSTFNSCKLKFDELGNFAVGSSIGEANGLFTNAFLRVFSTGNVTINQPTTDAGYRLDVNGTARVSGASSFGGNMNLSFNQNSNTSLTVSNTTAGTFAVSEVVLQSNTVASFGKTSSSYATFKTIVASDVYIYNAGAGDITMLNNFSSGNIKFTAGGSSTAQATLTNSGNLLVGTTTDTGYKVQIASPSADTHLNVWGATAPSIRLDNAASGATQRFVIGLATATNNFIQGANAGDVCMTPGTSSALVFGMWQTSSSSEVMRISTSSNVLIGKNTDSGQKLQVVGKVNLTSLPTSATGLVAGDIWNNGGVLNIV